jgi:hypothetical protein
MSTGIDRTAITPKMTIVITATVTAYGLRNEARMTPFIVSTVPIH